MRRLAREIVTIVVDEYGRDEFLRRISNPYWFQALGCVLGYDWHSSGVTTVVTGVLKGVIKPEEHGLGVVGGKGRASRKAPEEIERLGTVLGLSDDKVRSLKYSSRICAKVDNTAIQAGYPLYHHAFFVAEDGNWSVIQQGMNVRDKTARRYHWLSKHAINLVVEPHDAIVCDEVRCRVLDMTAKASEECRKTLIDLVNDGPIRIGRSLKSMRPTYQRTLREWMESEIVESDYAVSFLYLPKRINWKALKRAYEIHPSNYEELLSLRGIGPATMRGLALVSEIIYGQPPSWKDPVKYSFAYGGKDGVPYPVDRVAMDDSVLFLREALEQSKLGNKDKFMALKKLKDLNRS
jgi:hypothetical protein